VDTPKPIIQARLGACSAGVQISSVIWWYVLLPSISGSLMGETTALMFFNYEL
jgi:hypothetical protein